jgi:glutamyl-tRNA(Gln) amidotransferase subunit D
LKPDFNDKVALTKFHPGMKPELINWYVKNGFKGLVLEGTGLGHVSSDLLDPLRNAAEKGVLLGMTSQCLWGRINMNVYDRGVDLMEIGVLPLGDMLPETAMVKMMWVLAQTENLKEAKMLLTTNINGELDERTLYQEGFY